MLDFFSKWSSSLSNRDYVHHGYEHGYFDDTFAVSLEESVEREGIKKLGAEALPFVKTAVTVGVRMGTLPAKSILIKNIFEGATLATAWQQVKRKPFAGCKQESLSTILECGAIFACKDILLAIIHKNGLAKDAKTAELYASLPAAIVGTIVAAPSLTIATIVQSNVGKPLEKQRRVPQLTHLKDLRVLYQGLSPSILKNMCSWGIGSMIGSHLVEVSKDVFGDTTSATLAAKTAGWVIGSFVGSPFFNIQTEMRRHEDMKSMLDVIKKRGLIYSPEKYAPHDFKINSVALRLVIGIPLEQESLHADQTKLLKVYQFVRKTPTFWKGYSKGLSLIVISGLAIATAEIYAKTFLKD